MLKPLSIQTSPSSTPIITFGQLDLFRILHAMSPTNQLTYSPTSRYLAIKLSRPYSLKHAPDTVKTHGHIYAPSKKPRLQNRLLLKQPRGVHRLRAYVPRLSPMPTCCAAIGSKRCLTHIWRHHPGACVASGT